MRREQDTNSKFTPHLCKGAGFTCELCSKRVCMVIKEYGTGRWLCYECHYRKDIRKGGREALPERNNKNV